MRAQLVKIWHQPSKNQSTTRHRPRLPIFGDWCWFPRRWTVDQLSLCCRYFYWFCYCCYWLSVEVELKDFDEDDLRNDGFDAGVGLIVLFLRWIMTQPAAGEWEGGAVGQKLHFTLFRFRSGKDPPVYLQRWWFWGGVGLTAELQPHLTGEPGLPI